MKQIVFSCSHSRHTQLRLKRSYVSNGNKILFKSKNYPRNDNQWHTKKHTLEKRLFLIIFVFRFKSQIYDEWIRWWWLTKYSTFNIVLYSIQYELFRFFFFAVRSDLQQNDTQQFIVAVVVVVVTFFLSLWYFFCLVFAFTAHLFNRTDSRSLSLSFMHDTLHSTAQSYNWCHYECNHVHKIHTDCSDSNVTLSILSLYLLWRERTSTWIHFRYNNTLTIRVSKTSNTLPTHAHTTLSSLTVLVSLHWHFCLHWIT